MEKKWYSLPNDKFDKDKIMDKYEFNIKKRFYLQEHQEFIKNYISLYTPYNSVLLYNELGSGKTCSAISIAEGFKEYNAKLGVKILVLTKNKSIQNNFIKELKGPCIESIYNTSMYKNLLKEGINSKQLKKQYEEKINRKIVRHIKTFYQFDTFGSIANKILGPIGKNNKRDFSKHKINNLNNRVIIIDEVHNITNNDTYTALNYILKKSYNYKLILLSGTPISDNIKEIFELTNLLNTSANLPIRAKLLKSDLVEIQKNETTLGIKTNSLNITNKGMELLNKFLNGRVFYFKGENLNFPDSLEIGNIINSDKFKYQMCQMSMFQDKNYKNAFKSDIGDKNIKELNKLIEIQEEHDAQIVKSIESQEIKSETRNSMGLFKNSSDASTFIYPDGSYGKIGFERYFKNNKLINPKNIKYLLYNENLQTCSSKIYKLLDNILKTKDEKVFIFSNFVNSGGTNLLKIILEYNNFVNVTNKSSFEKIENAFIIFDSNISETKRYYLLNKFNNINNDNGEYIRIIIGSPIISEGITLKSIRQIHILEPSWNYGRILQVIGRGVRNNSHSTLPKEKQNVKIYKYISYSNKIETIDFIKYKLSENKLLSNNIVLDNLQKIGNLMNKTTITQQQLNKDTYNLFINHFEENSIKYIYNIIKQIFKINFLIKINDIYNIINYKTNADSVSDKQLQTVINYVIYILVSKKIVLFDKYNRQGYLILKQSISNKYQTPENFKNLVLMFIPENINPKKSIFDLYLNYYTFKNHSVLLKDYKNSDFTTKNVKSKTKQNTQFKKLTNEQQKLLEKLLKQKIFGSYYLQKKGSDEYYKDNVFRIINQLSINKEYQKDDKRRNLSGMACSSFKKNDLISIAQNFNIPTPENPSKEKLCYLIEKYFKENNLIMK